jgi:hypothetical protein
LRATSGASIAVAAVGDMPPVAYALFLLVTALVDRFPTVPVTWAAMLSFAWAGAPLQRSWAAFASSSLRLSRLGANHRRFRPLHRSMAARDNAAPVRRTFSSPH